MDGKIHLSRDYWCRAYQVIISRSLPLAVQHQWQQLSCQVVPHLRSGITIRMEACHLNLPDHVLAVVVVVDVLNVWRTIVMCILWVVAAHCRSTCPRRLVVLIDTLLPGHACNWCRLGRCSWHKMNRVSSCTISLSLQIAMTYPSELCRHSTVCFVQCACRLPLPLRCSACSPHHRTNKCHYP